MVVVVLIAVIVVGVVLFRKWINTDKGRLKWDAFKLKPPIFGPLIHKVALARFSHTLASLIQSGVPILESLDIVSDTAGNRIVGDVLLEAKDGVREGRALADTLARARGRHPSARDADGRGRRTDRCPRQHAAQGRRVLRRRGRDAPSTT